MASVGVPDGPLVARWQSPARALSLAAAAALAIGALSAAASPLAVAGALFALLALALVWWRPASGVFLFVVVIAVLPFGVIPVQVGVQLTLVDAVLIATFSAVLMKLI